MVGFGIFGTPRRPVPGACMHSTLLLPLFLSLLSLGLPVQSLGADAPSIIPPEQIQGLHKPIEPTMPIYKPRKGSALRGRVDGGFRGGAEGEPVIKTLAPADHVGETGKKSPALYWFISEPTLLPLEFTLEDSRQINPVLNTPIKAPRCPGIQEIRLADYGKALDEDVQYRWHLSVIVDPEARSKDIHTMAVIQRVSFEEIVRIRPPSQCKDPRDVFCIYAELGLWYDALQVISDLILAFPKDRVLRLMRAHLLDQVGLNDVAQWDRLQNGTPCPPRKVELNAPSPQLANGKAAR